MKTSTSIIAYVGNGVVKGGLVHHVKGKKPIILSARKKILSYYDNRDRAQIETQILSEFDTLIKQIKTEDFPKLHNKKCAKPDNALIILSSPWYLSETNTIKMQEATPFLITDRLISNATSNIIKAYKDGQDNVAVLEQNFLSSIINGYSVNNPIGKKVRDFSVDVFTSYSRTESIKKIENIISSNLHVHNIFIHSQSLVSFSAISDIFPRVKDYSVIDVTSALTEVMVIKENVLRDTASFPLGRYFLMQNIAKSMNTSQDVAESMAESYLNNKLDAETTEKVKNSMSLARTEWLNSFSAVLKKISMGGAIPKDFYLFCPHDLSAIFKDFIENEEYQQFAMTEGKFEVKVVTVSDALSLCDIDKDANLNQEVDISIIVGALFNNKKIFA